MAGSSSGPAVGDPGGTDDARATSAAPPPPTAAASAASNDDIPERPVLATRDPDEVKKPVYPIFAPRSAGASDGTGPAAGTSNGGGRGSGSKGKSRAATITTTKKKKQEPDNDEGNAGVLSLVEDSGDSSSGDADVRIEASATTTEKRGGQSSSATAKRKKGGTTKVKGVAEDGKANGRSRKGADATRVQKRTTSRNRIVTSTTEDDDSDEELVFSETGSSASLRETTTTRRSSSRRGTPSALAGPSTSASSQAIARTASGSVILDLTTSPVRPANGGAAAAASKTTTKPKKQQQKKKQKQTPAAEAAAGGGDGGRDAGAFVPLAEMYGVAREKRRKTQEGIEPRWPTAEEHQGGWPVQANAAGPQHGGVWTTRDKGKGREVLEEAPNDGETAEAGEEGFLARYARDIDSAANRSPPQYLSKPRPLASLAFLLPSPLPSHPLLDRLAAPLRNPDPPAASLHGQRNRDQLWTVKYAPQCAEEVLGSTSRQSAGWLRDWLEELKVVGAGALPTDGKKRRRKVARGIDPTKKKKRKKRRRDGLDDFMASSSEDEDDEDNLTSSLLRSDAESDADEEEDSLLAQTSRPQSASTSSSSVFPSMTNLILLQGPSGSGKSSTVHAVAKQLGYEVFEVSAGFGRRGAKDLERYVGDAARNHVVNGSSPRKKGAGGGGGGALAALFGRQQQQQQKKKQTSTPAAAAKETTPEPVGGQQDAGPTQSLILIDEVDVFFKHEEDCWAGIAALATQSRRPIIMTCTDSAHVPFDTLNLQRIVPRSDPSNSISILPFEAPEPELATAFLSLVALNEGQVIPSSSLSRLYESSTSRPYPAWMLQQQMGTSRRAGGGGYGARPLAPGTSTQPLVSRDLRKALMQLQVACQRGDAGALIGQSEGSIAQVALCEGPVPVLPREEADASAAELAGLAPVEGVSLEQAALAADTLSFADAYVDTRVELMLEDAETGRTSHSNDVEYSHPFVENLADPTSTRLPFIGHEHDMARYLRLLAYRVWEGGLRFGETQDEDLESKRAEYTSWFGLIAQSGGDNAIVQPPAAILPSPLPILEIAPLLRHLTRLDDQGERALLEASRSAAAAAATTEGDRDELDPLALAPTLHAHGSAAITAGPGAQFGPRRSTRQKLKQGGGQPVFERRLPWASEAEASWLRQSGFDVE